MKVLHLIPSLELGGAPQGVVELLNCQVEQGLQVQLVAMGSSERVLPRGLQGFPTSFMGLPWRFSSWSLLRRHLNDLANRVARDRIDILHTHLLPADYVGARFVGTCRGKTAHISHIRGTLPWLKRADIRNSIKRNLYRRAFHTANTFFVAVSEEARKYSQEAFALPATRMTTVLNGIDFSRFPALTTSDRRTEFHIGAAGRFCPEKGQEGLIRAVAKVREQNVNIVLTLAGSGGLEGRLRSLANELNIADRVKFAGDVLDMNSFYRSLDLFVLPSVSSEGLARVLLEAMYCCVPVIATNACGNSEAIRHQIDGLLVSPQSVDELASAIQTVAKHPPLARQMAANAHARAATKFDVRRVCQQLDVIYQSLNSNRAKSPSPELEANVALREYP